MSELKEKIKELGWCQTEEMKQALILRALEIADFEIEQLKKKVKKLEELH